MKNLHEFKIVKYVYPFTSEMLGEKIWDKMTEEESKWALMLTLKGITDTGNNGETSWDLFFLDDKLRKKIEDVLMKYEVPFEVTDQSSLLLKNPDLFPEEFLQKLDSYLNQHLTVDDVLDNIIEVGLNNISIFEKYFLKNNKENKDQNGFR